MIRVQGVVKRFGRRRVLGPVDLTVAPGGAVSIMGPSGCGKTTLLRAIAGLAAPDEGTISIAGENGASLPPHRRGIGFVFQSAALWPHLNVRENIAFGLPGSNGDEVRIDSLLDAAGLAGFGERRPDDLSGGEAQRVGILRALAARPRILLLDEPVSHLDPDTSGVLMNLIIEEARMSQAAVVLVTHEEATAERLGGARLRLNAGGAPAADRPR